ncbi:hypothetical protein [Pseudomonas serbica]|uniref:hypothetical protein n=1 Tax=Pseudomonas serbica TaxID=2965074 RepID=UPI00237AA969|nr:hypothetical protein [Pseudomonas serbica]
MARPIEQLAEHFLTIETLITDQQKYPQVHPYLEGWDSHLKINSRDFLELCEDLTNEAIETSGSCHQALEAIHNLPHGAEAAKGFLQALGTVAGNVHAGAGEGLEKVWELLKSTKREVISGMKEGFTAQQDHMILDVAGDDWGVRKAALLALRAPEKLLGYSDDVLNRNSDVIVDIANVIQANGQNSQTWIDFKTYIIQLNDSDVLKPTEKSRQTLTELLNNEPNQIPTGRACSNKVKEIAEVLANPHLLSIRKFTADINVVSRNGQYMKTSFLSDFTSVLSHEKNKLRRAGVAFEDELREMPTQQREVYKKGIFCLQKMLIQHFEDSKIVLGAMMLDVSCGESMDIMNERSGHPLWLEKTLAKDVPDIEEIEDADDPASVYLTILLKTAMYLDFDQQLPMRQVVEALNGPDKIKKHDFSIYPSDGPSL